LSKQQTSTDWGAPNLTKEQQEYAASDVVYLHRIFDRLMEQLERLGRVEIAKACSDFLTHRVTLDLMHFDVGDIFSHHSSSVS
jgi:ribonuclease D